MKRCIAFVAEARSENSWRKCRRAAGAHSVFCSQHEQVIAGIMLGLCVCVYPDRRPRQQPLSQMPVASRVPS